MHANSWNARGIVERAYRGTQPAQKGVPGRKSRPRKPKNPVNTAESNVVTAPSQAEKSAAAQTLAAQALSCPHCHVGTVRKTDQTEWIVLFRCQECGWRFAKSL
jgi:hypothetical protein